jgi:hypothetical protein
VECRKLIFLLLLLCPSARATVKFDQGFAVVQGNAESSLTEIKVETLIYCNPSCVIERRPDDRLVIPVLGFGSLGTMLLRAGLDVRSDKVQSFLKGAAAKEPGAPKKAPGPESAANKEAANSADQVSPSRTANRLPTAPYKIEAPYPKDDTLFLFRKGGSIPILPKVRCEKACVVKVRGAGPAGPHGTSTLKKFDTGELPLFELTVDDKNQGQFVVELDEGGSGFQQQMTFDVRPYNAKGFGIALGQKRPIVILP